MNKATLYDSLHFVSTLTFRKLTNAVLLWCSYGVSRFSGRLFHAGQPLSLSIEPTTACNLGCPECPSGLRSFSRKTGSMSLELAQQIIHAQHRHLMYLGFYFQGEPFLNKHLLEMVRYAASLKIYTGTSTNGHFLSDEIAQETVNSGLSRLIISVDGPTETTYSAYRKGGSLSEVIAGTRRIMKWKKQFNSTTPYVVIQCVVFRHNEQLLAEMRQLARELEVDDIWFKSAQVYDYKQDPNALIPLNNRYSRYSQTEDGRWPKNADHAGCWRMWHGNVATWDGKVVPCCFDKDAQYAMGDLNSDGMKAIWRSEPYDRFRYQLMKGRKNIDICSNCSEGLHVRLEKN